LKSPDGDLIDHGLVLWFPGPESATGEDLAEFHVHGSPAVINRLLSVLQEMPGCTAAGPGDFTRRAFANGRMDLMEVEGLADLFAAETEGQRRLALRQLTGAGSAVVAGWRLQLVDALAWLEASIDFADEDGVADSARGRVSTALEDLKMSLSSAAAQAERGGHLRTGIKVVVVGPPNAGKSSLVNRLALRQVALVSPEPGTTRDVLEARIVLDGFPVILTDTAGLRREDRAGDVERQGMKRAREEASSSDLVILVMSPDTSDGFSRDGLTPDLVVWNKADIAPSIPLRNDWTDCTNCQISAATGEGVDGMLDLIRARLRGLTTVAQTAMGLRERHVASLNQSIRHLNDALALSSDEMELVSEHVRLAIRELERLSGRVEVDDVLGRIFGEFCVGK
jgi:tRNA modification GTPase